jgi:glycogen operon protein
MDSTALATLASRCGILPSFLDARGDTRVCPPPTQRALLAAMGLETPDENAARAQLELLDRREWQRSLPPCMVVVEGYAVLQIPVNLPAGTRSFSWRIDCEDGEILEDEVKFKSLDLKDRKALDLIVIERRQLQLALRLPPGYHKLSLKAGSASMRLIIAPRRCWLPPQLESQQRLWGVAVQLYTLQSSGNWGIGNFSDLAALGTMLAALGADVIGLNPLHALFTDAPEQASPYSPASRTLLNVLNIDVAALAARIDDPRANAAMDAPEFKRALAASRASPAVDYTAVAAATQEVLRLLFDAAATRQEGDEWQHFERFRRDRGEAFERECVFRALRESFARTSSDSAAWQAWPEEFRDVGSAAVARFRKEQADAVTFQAWQQFVADSQLAGAAQASQHMAIGLYRDLAVGCDPGGAETWTSPTSFAISARVGAPPDIHNPAGQDWGLPPFDPRALRDTGYEGFIQLIRANMRHAGGLRIDHVMALQQLYWVPTGQSPRDGAYVRYPLDDLVGILALESQRQRCVVVGEDLGTVPKGFRERMERANILSYRVLFFERTEAGFLAPGVYPFRALAVVGSHDLPTLRGWWQSADIELKQSLGLYPSDKDLADARRDRQADRTALLAAFETAGYASAPDMGPEELLDAAHRFLAASSAALAVVQLDDVTLEAEQINVPGTSTEHPNWRRKLRVGVEQLSDDAVLRRTAEIFNAARHPTDGID